ncbi:unnamed protein product [Ectocarpus sp. 4 AP-2014]
MVVLSEVEVVQAWQGHSEPVREMVTAVLCGVCCAVCGKMDTGGSAILRIGGRWNQANQPGTRRTPDAKRQTPTPQAGREGRDFPQPGATCRTLRCCRCTATSSVTPACTRARVGIVC